MMKYAMACAAFASCALYDVSKITKRSILTILQRFLTKNELFYEQCAEARITTTWAKKKVEATKFRLERAFGKGLVGAHNEEGKFDPSRLGWINQRTGGAPFGSSISVTVYPGLTIDASTNNAYLLGFVNGMQYNGLARPD